MHEEIAKLVVEARHKQDMSQAELASRTDIPDEELQYLESGHYEQMLAWPVLKLKRLAEILDLSMSSILGEQILNYEEWALVWSALIEYSANQPGLTMNADMKHLIDKVQSFIPAEHTNEENG